MQYVYEDAQMGSLIRVLAGFFDHRPESLDKISTEEERFLTFFPVRAAESEKIIEFVGNEPVPERCQKLPTFRSPGKIDTINKRVINWWLWDGETAWRVETLTEEQKDFPIKAIWNDTLLRERVMAEWRPRDYV